MRRVTAGGVDVAYSPSFDLAVGSELYVVLRNAIDDVEQVLSGRPSDAGPVEDTDEWMMLRFFCAVAAPVV